MIRYLYYGLIPLHVIVLDALLKSVLPASFGTIPLVIAYFIATFTLPINLQIIRGFGITTPAPILYEAHILRFARVIIVIGLLVATVITLMINYAPGLFMGSNFLPSVLIVLVTVFGTVSISIKYVKKVPFIARYIDPLEDHIHHENYDQLADFIQKTLQKPFSYHQVNRLATCYVTLNQLSSALDLLEKKSSELLPMEKHNPTAKSLNSLYFGQIALIRLVQEQLIEAKEAIDRSLNYDSHLPIVFMILADWYVLQDRLPQAEESIERFEKALSNHRNMEMYWGSLAKIAQKKGDSQQADHCLNEYKRCAWSPYLKHCYQLLEGEIYHLRGERDKAITSLESLLMDVPQNTLLHQSARKELDKINEYT